MNRTIVLLIVLVAGCATSRFPGDPIKDTDALFTTYEAEGIDGSTPELSAKLLQLYADSPDYIKLINLGPGRGERLPRPRTMVPPKYPLEALKERVKASVSVAFLVNESGVVQDARIVESSDARFSLPALKAVRQWAFYPGTMNDIPDRFILVVPFEFQPQR